LISYLCPCCCDLTTQVYGEHLKRASFHVPNDIVFRQSGGKNTDLVEDALELSLPIGRIPYMYDKVGCVDGGSRLRSFSNFISIHVNVNFLPSKAAAK